MQPNQQGILFKAGIYFDGEVFTPRREDYGITWYPEDLGYSQIFHLPWMNLAMFFFRKYHCQVKEMIGSNIAARFVSPTNDTVKCCHSIFSVEANSVK